MKRCQLIANPSNKKEWLAERRKKVSATDVPVLLGLSPFKTTLQLFREKLFGAPYIDNEHIRRGIENEPKIIAEWTKQRNAKSRSDIGFLVSVEHPWLGATPDCIARYKNASTVVEIKCPKKVWKVPPQYYVWQVKVQLIVTGIKEGLIVAADANDIASSLKEWPVTVTEEEKRQIVRASNLFNNCVQEKWLHPKYWEVCLDDA